LQGKPKQLTAGRVQATIDQAEQAGWLGAAGFIAVYAVSAVFLVPASVLTLGAGAVYGPLKGTAVVSAASTLGSLLAFLNSRYLARPLAQRVVQRNASLKSLDEALPREGAKLVLLLRLSPLVPYTLLNYACGAPHTYFGIITISRKLS
jgi:uncharacterized membrane protein YdjX (TVP38/TMEM64 family)